MYRIGILAGFSLTCIASATIVQWTVESGGNGHWYEVRSFASSITWQEAEAIASAAGGYLATVTSAAENEFIYNLSVNTPGAWHVSLPPEGDWHYGPWLGGVRDSSSPSQWNWISGEAWSFQAWYFNQPDSLLQRHLAYGVGASASSAPVWSDTFADEPVHSLVIEYCVADFNNDSGVDDLDVTAFFVAFEDGDARADVNRDSGIDDLDITEFFTKFELGC